jgi:hypothetical protein
MLKKLQRRDKASPRTTNTKLTIFSVGGFQVVGYRSVDDPTISDKQRKAFEDEDVRSAFNVLTRAQCYKTFYFRNLRIFLMS